MSRRRASLRFSFWIIPAGLGCGVVLIAIFIGILNATRPDQVAAQNATAVLTIIYAPTSTPQPLATMLVTSTATQAGSGITIGGIRVGIYVQISGTGGDGLRLRKEPGTNSEILFLGYESEVFEVTNGPQEIDGYVWWHLTAPYDKGRNGWAAANYLSVIELEP